MSNNDKMNLIKVHVPPQCLKVYVQKPCGNWEGKTVFLTVHDVGSTPHSFMKFVNSSAMDSVKEHCVFLHVCVPGQEDALTLSGDFPSMDQLGASLVHVLNTLDVQNCVGIGEGAGADILCRFAMAWPNRVLGLMLIHCLDTPHGIIDSFKEMLLNLRLDDGHMTSAAWDYLLLHKFGLHGVPSLKNPFIAVIRSEVNSQNLSRYLYAYNRRTDISANVGQKLANIDILLVTGSRAPHIQNVRHMFENLRRDKSTLLVIDDKMDALIEAPDRVARSLILFCKGFGALSGVETPGIVPLRSSSVSMEEADRPTRKFSSLTEKTSSKTTSC